MPFTYPGNTPAPTSTQIPSGSGTPGASQPWYNSIDYGDILNALIQGGSAYASYAGAANANAKNIKLAREQRAWEEQMSNTAVQRRANDIEKAGGNRALAFVTGQDASTPTYTPARVENPMGNAAELLANASGKITAQRLQQQQMLQTSASIRLTTEQARLAAANTTNTQADTMLKLGTGSKVAAETKNLETTNREIEARISNLVTDKQLKEIQVYVATHTREDAIAAIKSGAIIQGLHVDTEGIKSDWARIKRNLLGILDTED